MAANAQTLTCSAAEAAYLGALVGARSLIGFSDPFPGWLAEEVQPALAQVRDDLAGRRVLTPQPDGTLTIAPAAEALVRTCGFAGATLVLSHSAGEQSARRHYYIAGELIVEQVPDATDHYRLTALAGGLALLEQAQAFLGLGRQAAPAVPGAALPEDALTTARQLAERAGADAAGAALEQAGMPPLTATALAHALAQPAANSLAVAMIRRQHGWEVDGLGLLDGPAGLWRLRPFARDGASWVEATPCTGAGAAFELRRVLNMLLPAPLGP